MLERDVCVCDYMCVSGKQQLQKTEAFSLQYN